MERLDVPIDHLERFERALDPAHPERCPVPVEILGYGEMSTVLAFDAPGTRDYAFKRMALFRTSVELDAYEHLFVRYNVALAAFGLNLPGYGVHRVQSAEQTVLYLSQRRLPAASMGHNAIRLLPAEDAVRLLRRVLRQVAPIFRHNAEAGPDGAQLGIDLQISNWAIEGFDPSRPRFVGDERLVFIDTNTPLMRDHGQDDLDPELFLRICPTWLVWIIEIFFLDQVLERYYDLREVTRDLLANLIKERRQDLIPQALSAVNAMLAEHGSEPLTEAEVRAYYREDAWIWRVFLTLRRIEQLTRTRLQGRRYNIILPGPIKR